MKRRFIFDLDGTLLNGNFEKEREYFKSVLDEKDYEKFNRIYIKLLMKYENKFKKYDIHKLSRFLSEESKVCITDKMIKDWIDVNSNMDDIINEGVIETLEYLKRKEISLVVLTNWFYKTQTERLKNAHLLEYFDYVYAGDTALKPNRESYLLACDKYDTNQCVIIGDNLDKDVYAHNMMGIEAIYYNPYNNDCFDKNKILSIKNMEELKERY